MKIKKLVWDSDFFGLNIGECSYEDLKKTKILPVFDVLYVSSFSDFDLILEDYKNTFSESKIRFEKNINSIQKLDYHISSIDASKPNKKSLYNLAFESGKNSRFLLDTNFELDAFYRLYTIWVDNSVSKKIATDVLVYQEENQIVGFVTYKITDKNATIGLIAVASNFQGKGIGSKLLHHLETILFQNSIKKVTIPTQETNIQACNFYKKQGYTIAETKYIKHYWKK